MRVWLFSIVRDEIRILPYFLRHYTPWCEKLVFYDGGSVDGTRELIAATPKCELREYPGAPGIRDDEFLHFAHTAWYDARCHADWVVFVDADEFLYHTDILEVLSRYLREGVQVPQVMGFTMFSREFPTTEGQIYDQVRAGVYDDCWSKPCIFREIANWTVGRHGWDYTVSRPRSSPAAELKLLHYRGLGAEYVRWRHARNWARVPDPQRRMHLGENCNPEYQGHHSIQWFEEVMSRNLPWVI